MKPSQKTGIEKPKTTKSITIRSIARPACQAARIPRGMPITRVRVSPSMASVTVGCTLGAIRLVMGRLENMDVPRSPLARRPTPQPELDDERPIQA